MAVVENGVDLGINGSSSSLTSSRDSNGSHDLDQSNQNGHPFHHHNIMPRDPMLLKIPNGGGGGGGQQQMITINGNSSSSGFGGYTTHRRSNSSDINGGGDINNNNNNNTSNTTTTTTTTTEAAAALKRERDMRELEELLSKLNPMAEEFVPTYFTPNNHFGSTPPPAFYPTNFLINTTNGAAYDAFDIVIPDANNNNTNFRRKRNNFNHGKRRINSRTSMAQREEIIKRTVYVSDIDQQVTEEQLAALFINCGQVVDCRICGDPNSVLRFAFIEFTDEEGAKAALTLAGTMLGYYPVRVLPSKTAIAPVNPTFLPRSEDEREMCARTIYCTNIDKKVTQTEVKLFFEQICGPVYRLRLLGDYHHSTRIAFVEFVMAESAIAALNCSGVVLGASAIRISPSKTPVRPRAPRPQMH